MDVRTAIHLRRAYRSLEPVEIGTALIRDLAECASLAPSCFNKQPWRFVFVADRDRLQAMRQAMNQGNEWTDAASLIVAVCTRRDLDCVMKDGREYALFDTGMASANLILRATELGLVAHPIAGYDPAMVRTVLGIPADLAVVTLINIGSRAATIRQGLPDWAVAAEAARPQRLPFERFASIDRYGPVVDGATPKE
ncbi:MAG: nitroreductase family protein [Candidatus Edwardsbacteria bacterium]|jgi:nitroreductase|nr:nitroreductase family protein [Candidatus Edwardsbacteria bacterium]